MRKGNYKRYKQRKLNDENADRLTLTKKKKKKYVRVKIYTKIKESCLNKSGYINQENVKEI